MTSLTLLSLGSSVSSLHTNTPVKLGPHCFSEWGVVPIGVPQGTKLGLWLFIIIINKLDAPAMNLWKYLDDTTILETIGTLRYKDGTSYDGYRK